MLVAEARIIFIIDENVVEHASRDPAQAIIIILLMLLCGQVFGLHLPHGGAIGHEIHAACGELVEAKEKRHVHDA